MDEINENYNYNVEYNQKISNLDKIKVKYEKQMIIFEGIKSNVNYNERGNFWIYNAEIKNEFLDFNDLADELKTKKLLSIEKSIELKKNIDSYHELHLTYENNAFNALNYFYNGEKENFLIEYDNLRLLQTTLFEKIDSIELTLQLIPKTTELSIEYIMSNFQILQWTMIFLIGIITAMLVFFLNQTNTNLKSEIKAKTKNLQKLNEKLKNMDKKRGEFISIASHELRGPIQPIFGFVELAKTGVITKQEALQGISTIASNLENIANNVLDLTKIENDELELHLDKTSINDIIQDVVTSEQFNPDRKVPIKTKLDLDIEIYLDKTRIKQVFRNILDNCIKFTETGEIKIQTHLLKDEKTIKIIFSDTGPEIPNDILPKIFKKFVTKGNNTVSSFGLGLYISKKIIDAHKGKILAYNYQGGPVFEIVLPLISINFNSESTNLINVEKTIRIN